MQPFNQYMQEEEVMNDRGLPGDRGRQFAQPGEQQIPLEAIQPGMNYTGDNMSPDMNMSTIQTEDLSQFKLDGNKILFELRHSWMGNIFNPNTNRWEKIGVPLISIAGVGRLIQILNPLIGNVDNRLSNLGPDYINDTIIALRAAVRTDLMLNSAYRLDTNEPLDVATILIILEQITTPVHSLLNRSVHGFTVQNTGHTESHTYQHAPPKQGGGFPSIFR